jgi:HEPN domain-containing protein
VPAKREILSKLTKENLLDLARAYDVEVDRTWPKDALVEGLAISRRIKTEGLVDLAAKVKELGNIPDAVFGARQSFFDETVVNLWDQVESVSDSLSAAIAAAEIFDPGYIDRVKKQVADMQAGKLYQIVQVPAHIWGQLSGRQQGAYGRAKTQGNYVARLVESALQLSSKTDFVKKQAELRSKGLPPRIEYYVLQAHRAYVGRCYDATIVMIARALEHLIKEKLTAKGVAFPETAGLGKLVEVYRRTFRSDKCLEKVLEVSNMDRIISAHDIAPYDKQMEEKDADLAWTAFEIVLRDLP